MIELWFVGFSHAKETLSKLLGILAKDEIKFGVMILYTSPNGQKELVMETTGIAQSDE